MHRQSLFSGAALVALAAAALGLPSAASAQTNAQLNTQIQSLQQQIQQLQQQLQSVQSQVQAQPPAAAPPAATAAATAPPTATAAAAAAAPSGPRGAYDLGSGVRLQLGGFIEAAGIYRSRNEVADVGSDFNTGIPFNNNVLAHEQELRGSARQSRISGLVTGDIDKDTHVAAYVETDFLSAGSTSNSRESNSYSLRLRHGYATVDMDNIGFHFLGGQEWSLLTTNTVGIIPRQEQIPLTIDAQYVPGFNWTRNPQFRFVENFGGGVWAGLSVESPQGVLPPGTNTTGSALVNANNNGNAGGLMNPDTQYTNDLIPDIVGKIALDPGWGHYEIKGLGRMFTDRVAGRTNAVWGYGVGGAATMPIIPKLVDLQISGLAGYGIGRYGSAQLPDAAFTTTNGLVALPEIQGLVGIITHPAAGTDVYLYGGWEHADRAPGGAHGTNGYGWGGLNNTGCNTEGSSFCQAQTNDIQQVTLGAWHDLFKGTFGRIVFGLQGSYTERKAFSGAGGAPNQDEKIVMTSFRYYPF